MTGVSDSIKNHQSKINNPKGESNESYAEAKVDRPACGSGDTAGTRHICTDVYGEKKRHPEN
jgi:hypothetical protein